jgi:hypothetical protein
MKFYLQKIVSSEKLSFKAVAEECFFLLFQAWVTKTAESSFALISINSDTVQFGLTKNILFCKLRGLGIDQDQD